MILNDREIRHEIHMGLINIEKSAPGVTLEALEEQVNPGSIDLTIGPKILRPNGYLKPITLGAPYDSTRYWTAYDETERGAILLKRGEIILAAAREYIQMPDHLAGHIMLKSSTARLFIEHLNAGLVDAGYHGRPTFELINLSPVDIIIPIGARVCQIEFTTMTAPACNPYDQRITSRYNAATEPEAAKGEVKGE